jgi:hypothetical protein
LQIGFGLKAMGGRRALRLFRLIKNADGLSLCGMWYLIKGFIRRIVFQAVLLVFAWCFPLHGALLSGSDPRFGPGSLTVDTRTGLAWLNLAASAGLSYDEMTGALEPGGAFAGFRYATAQEVAGLFSSGGISVPGWISESDPAFQSVTALINLVGQTSSQDGFPEAGGISGTWGKNGLVRPILDFVYQTGAPGYMVSGYPAPAWEFGSSTASSSWLVTSIPEPGAAGTAVLGGFFVMLGGRLRRKNG